uniref:O-methyltransferase domain-containing protein n=1 Tax=Lotus japonicus TaxID=34305 RepID=I3RZD1_LOTJA|nr:unknown [Lotus japonicus]
MGSANGLDASELFEGQALLYMNMFGFLQTMSLKWAMQQGIADIIYNHGKPITFTELVTTLQIPPAKTSLVKRLMRFLGHNGIFAIAGEEEEDHEAYDLTPASKLLISKAAHAGRSDPCLAPIIRMSADPLLINKFHQLGEFLSGDVETLYEVAYGKPVGGFLKDNPEYQSIFNEAMASDSQLVHLALKNCSSVFEGLDTLVDVGGGTGTTARSICEAFPKLKIVVYDLPQVVGNLSGSNNLSFVGGDMFKSIPEADAVLLKWVLHDGQMKFAYKF